MKIANRENAHSLIGRIPHKPNPKEPKCFKRPHITCFGLGDATVFKHQPLVLERLSDKESKAQTTDFYQFCSLEISSQELQVSQQGQIHAIHLRHLKCCGYSKCMMWV